MGSFSSKPATPAPTEATPAATDAAAKPAPVATDVKPVAAAAAVTAAKPVAAATVSKPAAPVSKPAAAVATAAPAKAPAPAATGQKLRDVTLRPIVFGIGKELTMVSNPTGKGKVISPQVSPDKFNEYMHVLKIMAQLSRIVYCDLSVIHEVVVSAAFGKTDNAAVNDLITELDKKYSADRKVPADDSTQNEGRPMQSYTEPLCTPDQVQLADSEVLTYVSSPSDVTFIIVGGKHLRDKSDFFKDDDLVVCFKGSSTMKNFKHDLYSQFDASELNELVKPAGLVLTDKSVGKVTGAFVKPLMKIWATLKREIIAKKPKRLFITGHSLGGAYASMFAFIVAECHAVQFPTIKSAHLITFGAPTMLSDKARNTFNQYLTDGFLTLDRVVSQAKNLLIIDAIPSIPAGFTHPGFQPLKTELYRTGLSVKGPEEATGRAYQLKNIEGVFKGQTGGKKRTQKGGALFAGPEKKKYEKDTKLHMPTRIVIDATKKKSQGFPHAEYWDMTYFGGFRMPGMKNPAYKGNTFVGRVYPTCISYAYETADPTEATVADPVDNAELGAESGPVVPPSSEEAAVPPSSEGAVATGNQANPEEGAVAPGNQANPEEGAVAPVIPANPEEGAVATGNQANPEEGAVASGNQEGAVATGNQANQAGAGRRKRSQRVLRRRRRRSARQTMKNKRQIVM